MGLATLSNYTGGYMNRRTLLAASAGALILPSTLIHVASAQDFDESAANDDIAPANVASHVPSAAEWTMVEYLNDYRAANGLGRVEMSRSLAAAARHHAYYMAQTDDVDHSLGSTSWSANIYNYGYPTNGYIGENVAAGRSSASGTLNQWKLSSGHNANLLHTEYIRIGVGRVYRSAGQYDYYWCMTFGSWSHRTIYN
jgi:uncharacterized protein YkwD